VGDVMGYSLFCCPFYIELWSVEGLCLVESE
jgi:hypothetical protein